LIAALLLAASAGAQTGSQDPSQGLSGIDRFLLRGEPDGDPRNPQRFRRPQSGAQNPNATRAGEPSNFDYQPGVGAGATGFDSSNIDLRRKKKTTQKAKPGSKAKAGAAAQPSTPAASAATAAAPSPAIAASRPLQGQRRPVVPVTGDALVAAATDTAVPRRAVPPQRPLSDPPLPDQPNAAGTDPFGPTGVLVGGFLLKPAVEFTGAHDSNAPRTTSGKPSWYSLVAPELLVNSNWARHELTANLRGSYTSYENASDLNRPTADAKVNGRVDVTTTTRMDLEGRFQLGTDNPGSPNIQAGLRKLPIYTTLGGTAALTQSFNRFEVALKGGADRTVYQPSVFTDGTTGSNDDRDYNRYLGIVRTSYELNPGAKPFVEFGADRRLHDLAVDHGGMRRDSDGRYLKGGSTFEISRILTGEVAVGWIERSYKDPALPGIGGLTVDSSLTWLPSALTAIKLTAATTVDESTLAGVAGVFRRDVGIQVDHAFRRWLIATLKFTHGFDDYVGSTRADDRYALSALVTYKLNREWQLKAEYRREWLRSNTAGADYTADVVLFGLRLQR
jgi:hypothetical protein